MENERREDNPPEENAPGQPPQYNEPPQYGYPPQGGPQGPYPPQQGNCPPPQNYPPQGGYYPNQPPQHGQWGAPPGCPQGYYVWRNLHGVRGWLLFLCIYLTIIVPVLAVIIFAVSLDDVKRVIGHYPEFGNLFVIDTILSVLLMGFCILAGCSLWAVRSHAVGIAKACMIFGMIYRVTAFVLLLTASGLPMRITKMILPSIVFQMVVAIGILVAWLVYLCVSKRVAITYGRPLQEPQERGPW